MRKLQFMMCCLISIGLYGQPLTEVSEPTLSPTQTSNLQPLNPRWTGEEPVYSGNKIFFDFNPSAFFANPSTGTFQFGSSITNNEELTFKLVDVEYESSLNYSFSSSYQSADTTSLVETADFYFVQSDDVAYGVLSLKLLNTDLQSFEFFSIGGDMLVCGRHSSYIINRICGNTISTIEGSSNLQGVGVSSNSTSTGCDPVKKVRLKTVVSSNDANTYPYMKFQGRVATDVTNDYLENSGIDLEIDYLGYVIGGNYQLTNNDPRLDAASLSSRVTAQMRGDADMVVWLTSHLWNNGTVGIVKGIDGGANDSYAYVSTQAAISANMIFAHEVGHLLGARHETDPNGKSYANGYFGDFGWLFFTNYKITIMHTSNGSDRIGYYSNPDVEYKNDPTGTATRDNARAIDERKATVAQFRTESAVFHGTLGSFPTGSICDLDYQFTTNLKCGTGPYTYQWFRSNNGGYSYYPVSASTTADQIIYTLPAPDASGMSTMKMKCKVTDANNNIIELVTTATSHCPPHHLPNKSSILSQSQANDQITLSPNPVDDKVIVSFEARQDGHAAIDIIDLNGKVVKSMKQVEILAGPNNLKVLVNNLPAGSYILVLNFDSKIKKLPVVIN